MIIPATQRAGRKRPVLALGAVGLATVLIVAAAGGQARTVVPRTTRVPADDEVLAMVQPRGAAAAAPTVALDLALAAARRQVDDARRHGDPRYLGRAQATLGPWWDAPTAPDEVVLLRATIRQGLHDFAGARRDLDGLVARRPDDAQARVTRAVVATVTGDVDQARADCAALAAAAGELLAAACAAPLATRGGGARAAYDRLGTLLVDARPGPVTAWALTARGELARALGDDALAERWLRAALELAPHDVYTQAVLADLRLDGGRAEEVAEALAGAAAEPRVLRRASALARQGAPEAAELRARLRADLDASVARGDETHLRERALYFLAVEPDPAQALAAAQGNWRLQREMIDVRILLDAAAAAGDVAAAGPALAWIAAGAIDDAVLARAAAGLEAAR